MASATSVCRTGDGARLELHNYTRLGKDLPGKRFGAESWHRFLDGWV